jgi:hypothetical protein
MDFDGSSDAAKKATGDTLLIVLCLRGALNKAVQPPINADERR